MVYNTAVEIGAITPRCNQEAYAPFNPTPLFG